MKRKIKIVKEQSRVLNCFKRIWNRLVDDKRDAFILIMSIIIIIGTFVVGNRAYCYTEAKQKEYQQYMQIDSADDFESALSDSGGKAFVYATVETVDPVSYPDVNGEYMYIEKVVEELF